MYFKKFNFKTCRQEINKERSLVNSQVVSSKVVQELLGLREKLSLGPGFEPGYPTLLNGKLP